MNKVNKSWVKEEEIQKQLIVYLEMLEDEIKIGYDCEDSSEMYELLQELKKNSKNKIILNKEKLERSPSFKINKSNKEIIFAGIPAGHEFSSLILALLEMSGKETKNIKNISENTLKEIKNIKEELKLEVYVSLTCHNCPEVVQSINTMSSLNEKIKSVMIEGGTFKNEVESKNILAVPILFANGEQLSNGRQNIEEILLKLKEKNIIKNEILETEKEEFDILIVGGGPAGISAAIYAARKGLKTGIVSEKIGGQVMDTVGIENFISTIYTEGPKLVKSLEYHLSEYKIKIINSKTIEKIEKRKDKKIYIKIKNELDFNINTKALILSTGAKWRELNVPGEKEFKGKGVAYCPHCDGPLFKNKEVAVIGGGNSGVEAAIDLANIVKKVTLIEFGKELKADFVLQKKLKSLQNVNIITSAKTKEVLGINKLNGIIYEDVINKKDEKINLEGVFVQIGLVPNTNWLKETIDLNKLGEIKIDSKCQTNVEGIFAAGDCTDVPYKQIIIAIGEGAKASLSAFEYIIKNY